MVEPSIEALRIRRFVAQDDAAVIALWNVCGLTRVWNQPQRDVARKLAFQSELFFVGECEGRIVASVMAGYEGHRGAVNYLAVEPAWRGRGIGGALMRHVHDVLRTLGCPKINLLVRETNAEVIAFYRKLGYAVEPNVQLGLRLIEDHVQ